MRLLKLETTIRRVKLQYTDIGPKDKPCSQFGPERFNPASAAVWRHGGSSLLSCPLFSQATFCSLP